MNQQEQPSQTELISPERIFDQMCALYIYVEHGYQIPDDHTRWIDRLREQIRLWGGVEELDSWFQKNSPSHAPFGDQFDKEIRYLFPDTIDA